MKKTFLVLISFVAIVSAGCSNGHSSYDLADSRVDYSLQKSWLAMPGMTSTATATPLQTGLSSLEESALVDVFYIHPTTCESTDVQNCGIDDDNDASLFVMMEQASTFNAVGRIYAPKYRQMALYMYHGGDTPAFQSALTFAYEDVKSAFRYYLENNNHGRPFVIASHSQGTDHARRLIMEEVHGRPVQSQFVAAWTPGQPTPYRWFANDLPGIPPCTAPDQIACIAVWQTFGQGFTDIAGWNASDVYWDGQKQHWVFPVNEATYNVNPLTWTTGPDAAAKELNLGSLPLGVKDTTFIGLYPGVVGAKNLDGYLSVNPVPLRTDLYAAITTRDPLIFHSYDYALFWLNIRNNARVRVLAYLQQRLHVMYPLITSSNMASASVGSPFSYQIETVNSVTAYRATGLPDGLVVNPASGVISGTPTIEGIFPVVLKAENAAGSSTAELALTVTKNPKSSGSLEPVFFLHISDTHFDTKTATNDGLSADGTVDLTQSGKALMNALITEVAPVIKPLATTHTGDMAEKGYIAETWETYSTLLKSSILTSYPKYVDIVGNHDVKVTSSLFDYEDGLKNFLLYAQTPTKYGYTTIASPAGAVRLIRTDTAASTEADYQKRNWENIYGYFPESQQQALYTHPDRSQTVELNVVLGHSPVAANYTPPPANYVPGSNLNDGTYMYQITEGNGRMKQLIEEFKAPIYLSGHVHEPGMEWLSNKSLVVRADTFGSHGKQATFYLVANDFDANSPAAKLVHIDATDPALPSVKWPVVFITAPANSSLGNTNSYYGNTVYDGTEKHPYNNNYTAGNPNAQTFTADQTITMKTMVFSPETVTSVSYMIDGKGTSTPLVTPINTGGRIWTAGIPLAGLIKGSHTVTVTATRSNGTTGTDTISITVK